MGSCRNRLQPLTLAAHLMMAIGSTVVAADALATTVTPTDLQGWTLYDGGAGTSPAKITSAQPDAGNGSVELDINAGNQQPAVLYAFSSPITFGSLVGSDMSFGFSWLVPVGTSPNSSPVIRLFLSGLSGAGQSGRSDGSLGWYAAAADTGTWQTSSFSMTSGNFFFRVGGKGQESLGCNSISGSFDDRRQTLTNWASTCNGTGGTANIDNALVTGIEVDWGTFPGNTASESVYTDLINYNIGSNVGSANFEASASAAVPEPESMALMLLGLGLACGATVRGRRMRHLVASAPAN